MVKDLSKLHEDIAAKEMAEKVKKISKITKKCLAIMIEEKCTNGDVDLVVRAIRDSVNKVFLEKTLEESK